MTLVYGLCLAVFVLIMLLVLTIKIITFSWGESKKLEEKIRRQESVIRYLIEHTNKLGEIKKNSNELLRRIQNAQNDDDINNVIADIVNRNNNGVQNSAADRNGASAETEQGKTRSTKKR